MCQVDEIHEMHVRKGVGSVDEHENHNQMNGFCTMLRLHISAIFIYVASCGNSYWLVELTELFTIVFSARSHTTFVSRVKFPVELIYSFSGRIDIFVRMRG